MPDYAAILAQILAEQIAVTLFRLDAPVESGPAATVVSATVNETKRFEEPVGIERRKIDNSRSGTTAVRRMRAQRRWTRKCELMFEKGIKQSESGELKISQVASFRADVEQTFRKGYLSTAEEEQTFEEEIEVTIPPRIAVDVVLHWKKIWQEGVIVLKMSDGESYGIPYREVVGLTFDQENRDSS